MNRPPSSASIILIALAVWAMPTSASASVTLRETGTSVGIGAEITATQDGVAVFTTGEALMECNENWITGSVKRNDGTTFEGTVEGIKLQGNTNPTGTACKGLFGPVVVQIPELTNEGGTRHWCLKSIAEKDEIELLGKGCSTAEEETLTLVLESGFGKCSYFRHTGLKFTFTTTTEAFPSTVSVVGAPEFIKGPGGLLCPTPNLKVLQLRFQLFTDGAGSEEVPLQFDDVA